MHGVAGPGQSDDRPADERRQHRPYRQFLAIVVIGSALALSGVALRGIINTLDRLPRADTMDRPEIVDVRALRACAADLERHRDLYRDGHPHARAGGQWGTARADLVSNRRRAWR